MILESPTPSPALPRCSVFDYLFPTAKDGHAEATTDGIAFIDGLDGTTLTRETLRNQALSIAGDLERRGLVTQDVAMIFGTNSLYWVSALFGCQAAGLIVSPANYGYTESELRHQIVDSTAQFFFCSPPLLDVLEKALDGAFKDRIVLLCKRGDEVRGYPSIESMLGSHVRRPRLDSGTAYLCYSSGTTGRAKGVETTHHNITSQLQAVNLVYQPLKKGEDVVLGILPFSHIYGLTIVLHQPLTVGVPVVVLPRFEEVPVLQAIQQHRITWGLVVPPILLVLVHSKQVQDYDLSSLRGLQSGAAPLGVELIAAFEKRFHIPVTQGYGLTETSPVTHVMTASEASTHPGQIGRLMPTFQCRLVNDVGEDVEPGERGEMWFKGPSVMKGYWRNEEATRSTFQDGWFKTGDVAIVDKSGYYTIVDRVKELIKYKGFQVAPAELEALLLSHPKIADVAVIGVYDRSRATELPRAYVVPAEKPDEDALRGDITSWLETRVANHKRLRGGVVFIAAIPKSPSGKILRKDLRALAQREGRDAKL